MKCCDLKSVTAKDFTMLKSGRSFTLQITLHLVHIFDED